MEKEIRSIIESQGKMSTDIALLVERSAQKEKTIDKLDKDVESLKKFKWGLVGTAGFSIYAFIKTLWS